MGWWTDQVVPHLVDRGARGPEVMRLRRQVCAGLVGDVVEIGFGSGPNVACYPDAVTGVWAVEVSDVAWRLATDRVAAAPMPVRRAGLDAQRMDQPDGRFDAALSTFCLCTVADVDSVLVEVARVLRPGGTLHLLEHGRSRDPALARWQDRVEPVYGRLAGGCRLDRSIADALRRSPFRALEIESTHVAGPRLMTYVTTGTAHL